MMREQREKIRSERKGNKKLEGEDRAVVMHYQKEAD